MTTHQMATNTSGLPEASLMDNQQEQTSSAIAV